MKNKVGKVYKITNPEGKVYIGSTVQSIHSRWCKYKSMKCQSQGKIYDSMLEYGPDNHIFEVVWEGPADVVLEKEREYGEFYDVLDSKKGLNGQLPRKGNSPRQFSEENRAKIAKTSTGRVMPKRTKEYSNKVSSVHKGKKAPKSKQTIKNAIEKKKRGVCMYDKNWNYLAYFGSLKDASVFVKGNVANVCKSCKDGKTLVKNYRFRYSEDSKTKTDKVDQIDYKTGKLIKTWDNIRNVTETLGISRQSILGVCRGYGHTAGGYKWKYRYE